MEIYQLDTEKQALDPLSIGHNYAWTNTYLIGVPNDADAQLHLLRLIEIEAGILPIDTSIRYACWRRGIGGEVPAGVQFIGRSGDLPASTSYQPFANTARIAAYSGKKLVWYKRWRGPLRDIDMSGELLTSDYFELLTTSYVERLRHEIPLVTRSSGLITRWEVNPKITLWQRRDGSERNIRSVLAG